MRPSLSRLKARPYARARGLFGCVLDEALNHGTLAQPISGGHGVVSKILAGHLFPVGVIPPCAIAELERSG